MNIDVDLLQGFEAGLNPQNLATSAVAGRIIGFGEISAIFQIGSDEQRVYKRMPLFKNRSAAQAYEHMYYEYCALLSQAGIRLPEHGTCILEVPDRPVVLYIAQEKLPPDRFCHHLIHTLERDQAHALLERVVMEIGKVWAFNQAARPGLELALDGQLSNWVNLGDRNGDLVFIDTSTPLLRKNGLEQQDPELLLQSAPGFLRWVIRLAFLADVMNRYYSPRLVFTDLAANLYKEQRPDLVPEALSAINGFLESEEQSLGLEEVRKYYQEDKWIWTLFLAFRRLDRLIKTRLLGRRYEFILPGKIKR